MQLAFIGLMLTAMHLSILVSCMSGISEPNLLHQWQHLGQVKQLRGFTAAGRFSMEINGRTRKMMTTNFLMGTGKINHVSIFDMRRRQYLCTNLKGDLFNSRERYREGCIYKRIWLDPKKNCYILYSSSSGRLLMIGGYDICTAHHKSPKPSSVLTERLLHPRVSRQRRNEQVNPSDPLRSESLPNNPAKDQQELDHGQTDQDQTGAVSKQTITSCDDPLRVLHSNAPVSPVKTNIADRAEQD